MRVETNKIKLKNKTNMHCCNKNSLTQEIPSIKTYKMHSSKNHDQKYFNQNPTKTGNHTRKTHDNIYRRQGKPNEMKKGSDVLEQTFIYK